MNNRYALWTIWVASSLLLACAKTDVIDETETHFLRACDDDSCGDGLSCICGVCTFECARESACDALPAAASCAPSAGACEEVAMACDVTCEERADCAALGAAFACEAGRCRVGEGGGSGEGGSSGEGGGSGEGGEGGEGGQVSAGSGGLSSGGAGGSAADGGALDAAIDAGSLDASTDDEPCDELGEACCDPFPGDGPNYCSNARLQCGASNTCEPNCGCALGAYTPVCGVDGQTYDATCGEECVPIEIECHGECPCDRGYCAVACTGVAPDDEVVTACAAITDMNECTAYVSDGFPASCRWVTPGTAMCQVP